MANHRSAAKRAKQSKARNLLNRSKRTRIKTALKSLKDAQGDDAVSKLRLAQSLISKASKSGAMSKGAASRKISRLTKALNLSKGNAA